MRLDLQNQEIFKLPGTYQHPSGGGAKPRYITLRKGHGKLGLERRPSRHAHCVPSEIVDGTTHVFSGIASGGGHCGGRGESVGCRSGWTMEGVGIDLDSELLGPNAGDGTHCTTRF